jgi:hypothetical protein
MLLLRPAAVVLAGADVLSACLVLFGVFVALPARWWPVDGSAAVLAAVEVAGGMGLLLRAPWARLVARAASAVALAVGLATVSALALTASWLGGIYGPVGRGGAIVLAFVATLALPYLVVLPVVQLLWLSSSAKPVQAPAE